MNNLKNIVVSIPNTLLSGGLTIYLQREPEFSVFQEDRLEQLLGTCVAVQADVLLVEVRHYFPYTIGNWLTRCNEIKEKRPCCRIAFIVDENSSPEVAREVRQARSQGLIDVFFYGTVSGEYLTAVLGSL